MSRSIFFNRRSGIDRRHRNEDPAYYGEIADRRSIDRRLYGDNGYLLVIGHTGLDRFTVLVTMPALAITVAALVLSSIVNF